MNLSNEDTIKLKIDCFKAGVYDVLVLSEKQLEAITVLCDNETDELLFGGAAGGAKSWTGCEWLLWSCLAYENTRWFVGRHHLNQVRDSVMETMKKVYRKHGIPESYYHYNDTKVVTTFYNGSVIKGVELMHRPGDDEFERFGSTEYTGGWIEEGGGVAYKGYEIAGTRIGRHLNNEHGIKGKLFITGNPSRNWQHSQFYKPIKKGELPPGKMFIQSLVGDNPFIDDGYEERLGKLTGATRSRLLLGDWDFSDDPLQLIENEAMEDLFTNDFVDPDYNDRILVLDIAMGGGDLLRGGVFYGNVLVDHDQMKKSGGKQVLDFAKRLQKKHRIPASSIIYDSDGVGAFLGGDGGFIPGSIPFHGNATPFILNRKETERDGDKAQQQKSEYANVKAQCGWLLAYDINERNMWAMSVTSVEDQEMLTEELAWIKKDKEGTDGALRLLGKDKIIVGLGRSPDFGDLWIMKKYIDLKRMSIPKRSKRKIRSI